MRQILLVMVLFTASEAILLEYITSSTFSTFPCQDDNDFVVTFEPGFKLEDKTWFYVDVKKFFPKECNITVVFDSDVLITFVRTSKNEYSRKTLPIGDTFLLQLAMPQVGIGFVVKGTEPGIIPYLLNFSVNGVEYCNNPRTGFLNRYAAKSTVTSSFACGRRLSERTVVNGDITKPGDWPWHAAVYRLSNSVNRYLCGGTLISKNFLISAAHCVTIRGAVLPDAIFSAVLGKNKLNEYELETQLIAVIDIIVHKDFNYRNSHNDISLLKLKTEAIFNDFVRPACLWHSSDHQKFPTGKISGTIVGWGYDDNDKPSETLQQATLPIASDVDCIKSHLAFVDLLNGKNFCAGARDGTSPCNGDSGGAFQVFIPDAIQNDSKTTTGTWHIRGILSSAIAKADAAICDPEEYVVFTDVEKFRDWIDSYLED